MNIWLVNHHANPPHTPGDARHYSYARELIRHGHEVRVIACNFDHLQHKFLPMTPGRTWEHHSFGDVPFTWIKANAYKSNYEPARIFNMLQFALRAWRQDWTRGLSAPDLVLGSTPDPFASLAAQRIASRYRVPFVLEVRDPWPYAITEIVGYSRSHPFVKLLDRVMRYLYKKAARIVIFSKHSSELLVRYGADIDKIVCIPHGVDLSFNPEPRPTIDDGLFTVTYLGAHNQWNSLNTVLDTAKILQGKGRKDILFRFVGDGTSKPELIARARVEQIGNVRFDDPVPKDQVPAVKHAADAFILNNSRDAVSKSWMSFSKIYDYLAAGRPVVFGSWTGDDPVRESGGGISVEAGNAEAMAEAIECLASLSPHELFACGLRGRRFIEANYSVSALVARFEAMALEIVNHPIASVTTAHDTKETRNHVW